MKLNFQYIEKLGSRFSNYKIQILALISYSILTIIFTYPVAFSITDRVPGGGDAFVFLSYFWWFKVALLNLLNPFFSPMIYYPSGVSLVFTTVTPFNSILSIPLQLAFGLVSAYNLIWIFTFIMSGFGTFLLVRYLTGDIRAAFISGLIFMFCPYHFAHALGHMNLTSMEWIPFYVLFLIKTIREENIKNSFYAGIFLFLIAACNYEYLLYLFTFTALILLFYLWSDLSTILSKNALKKIGVMVITFGVPFSLLIYPLLRELIFSGSTYMYAGGFTTYSADLLGFFIPAQFHPVFGKFVEPIYQNFTGNTAENTTFAGYAVLFLSAIAVFKIKTKKIMFWISATCLFFILSLGPILHFNGIVMNTVEGLNYAIPLPYILIMNIPIVSITRAPSRWDVLVMLSLAVLAGYGLHYIFSKYDGQSFRNISKNQVIGVIFAAIILFEFLAIPFPMSNTTIPIFYKQIANDTNDYAILEITGIGVADLMYYQTLHNKKLVNGYVSRTPESATKFMTSTPMISQLVSQSDSLIPEGDILEQNLTDVGSSILSYYNIRYVVLHTDRISDKQFNYKNTLLHESIRQDPQIFENDHIIVYKVENVPQKSFISLNEGWTDIENWSGTPTRWMNSNATLFFYSDQNRTTTLSMKVSSFYRPRILDISVADQHELNATVPTGFVIVTLPVDLHKGANIIRFNIPDNCQKPSDIPGLKNPDRRCLSMAVQNITFS